MCVMFLTILTQLETRKNESNMCASFSGVARDTAQGVETCVQVSRESHPSGTDGERAVEAQASARGRAHSSPLFCGTDQRVHDVCTSFFHENAWICARRRQPTVILQVSVRERKQERRGEGEGRRGKREQKGEKREQKGAKGRKREKKGEKGRKREKKGEKGSKREQKGEEGRKREKKGEEGRKREKKEEKGRKRKKKEEKGRKGEKGKRKRKGSKHASKQERRRRKEKKREEKRRRAKCKSVTVVIFMRFF